MRKFSAFYLSVFAASTLVAPVGVSAGTAKTGAALPQFRMWPVGYIGSKHYLPARDFARSLPPCFGSKCYLHYNGGPVLTTPHAYVIFWDFKRKNKGIPDPDGIEKLMREFFGNIGGSAYANIVTQYFQGSGTNKKFIGNPSGQGSFWDDVQHSIPARPTDSQIQQEALYGVARFGYDPSGTYIVITAYQHDPQGFPGSFCTYHGAFESSYGVVSYAGLPYMPDAPREGCGKNIISPPPDELGIDEGQTIAAGAIYEAAVTDPDPISGWYNNDYGEIENLCSWHYMKNDPFGPFSFTEQPLWSNAAGSCLHGPPF